MDAQVASGRQQVGGDDAITTRLGAVALPLGVIVIGIAEYFHPAKQDPMDNHAVFMEYAHTNIWTTVHFGEYFGFLLLLGSLVALYYSVSAKRGLGAGIAPFGLAAAVAVRWTEIAMNSFSFFLAGLTLFIFGAAIALGSVYPRWVGLVAAVSGAAFMYDGVVVVGYEGFVPSIVKLVGLLFLAVWAFIMAVLMWRNGGHRRIAQPEAAPMEPAQQPVGPR